MKKILNDYQLEVYNELCKALKDINFQVRDPRKSSGIKGFEILAEKKKGQRYIYYAKDFYQLCDLADYFLSNRLKKKYKRIFTRKCTPFPVDEETRSTWPGEEAYSPGNCMETTSSGAVLEIRVRGFSLCDIMCRMDEIAEEACYAIAYGRRSFKFSKFARSSRAMRPGMRIDVAASDATSVRGSSVLSMTDSEDQERIEQEENLELKKKADRMERAAKRSIERAKAIKKKLKSGDRG